MFCSTREEDGDDEDDDEEEEEDNDNNEEEEAAPVRLRMVTARAGEVSRSTSRYEPFATTLIKNTVIRNL